MALVHSMTSKRPKQAVMPGAVFVLGACFVCGHYTLLRACHELKVYMQPGRIASSSLNKLEKRTPMLSVRM